MDRSIDKLVSTVDFIDIKSILNNVTDNLIDKYSDFYLDTNILNFKTV
jgi:hypothetical protein